MCARKADLRGPGRGGGRSRSSRARRDHRTQFRHHLHRSASNLKKNWEPFIEAMSKAIGIKVNAFYASDYAGVIEAMRFNKVQVAWYGNKSASRQSTAPTARCLRSVVRTATPATTRHIIVHKDSP